MSARPGSAASLATLALLAALSSRPARAANTAPAPCDDESRSIGQRAATSGSTVVSVRLMSPVVVSLVVEPFGTA
jgi:hypothetical protein